MELFAEQQLKKQQLAAESTAPTLPIQTDMENLQLREGQHQQYHEGMQQLNQPAQEGLPHDFFTSSLPPPPYQQFVPQEFPPQVDLLTPPPQIDQLAPLSPPPPIPDVAPASSLLDLTPEDYAQPPPEPVFYSHLSALAPTTKVCLCSSICLFRNRCMLFRTIYIQHSGTNTKTRNHRL